MRWKHLDEVARPGRVPGEYTPEEVAAIEDVLDVAVAFVAGDVPFYEAAAIGTLVDWRGNVSPPYTRYMAMDFARKRDDPRKRALMALLDTLIVAEGYLDTNFGVFTKWEIRDNEAGWEHANFDRNAA